MKKIIGILCCTLLITSATLAGSLNSNQIKVFSEQNENHNSVWDQVIYEEEKDYSPEFEPNLQQPTIEIIRPEEALYFNDKKSIPLFFTTVIFGPITIEAEVSGGSVEKVEFYIDDDLKYTDYSSPFTWLWDETAIFNHEIKVIGYESGYSSSSLSEIIDQKNVFIFNFQSTPSIQLTLEEVTDILMNQIINPSDTNRISAFLLSEPLQSGDVVTSLTGDTYTIDTLTWFIFIDDEPESFYSHPTRYVFLDDSDSSIEIINQQWPPEINNYSLFYPANLNRGDLIEIYSAIDIPNDITAKTTQAPSGDYGDAPDGQEAYHGITGQFPTLYATKHSVLGRPGGHILHVGEETLGTSVSAEIDALDPLDPDGVPNLVDADNDERTFVLLNGGSTSLSVTVTVKATAPDVPRYINILVDLDQNGKWTDGTNGKEWIVINKEISVTPGTTETITFHGIIWGTSNILASPVWIRTALTRETIDETIFSSVGGWDGSGEFQYGEIEDQLLFHTDTPPIIGQSWPPWPANPPGGNDPNPGQPPGPQPPGPTKGPCGTDVNYHVIIINCGDSAKHMSQGINPGKEGSQKVADMASDQGYNQVANLGPGKGGSNENTLENIGNALDNLASAVKCGDHVLIYIIGHGKSTEQGGGISLKGADGKEDDVMKPNDLSNMLNKIPPCPDEDCDTAGKCCHVTIVIESCHAGNFNVDGVTGEGRTVMGSCQADQTAAATGGGSFTNGFVGASRDADADTDGDGDVEPGEAYEEAEESVDDYNKKTGHQQDPWTDSNECECKCPCQPSIVVDKRINDPSNQEWVNEIDAPLNEIVTFGILIGNDGKCRNVTDLAVMDFLPPCLAYEGNARMYLNEEYMGLRPADSQVSIPEGTQLTWDLNEISSIAPGDEIHIIFEAETIEEGPNENYAEGSALCSYDPSVQVTDSDTATVYVTAGQEDNIPPVTTKTIGEPQWEGGYTIASFTPLYLEAIDPEPSSGVQFIHYEVWHAGILYGSNEVPGDYAEMTFGQYEVFEGNAEIRWYAVDNAGNTENTHTQEHFILY